MMSDTKIFCQLPKANETLANTAVQRMLNQINLTAALAEDSHSVDENCIIEVRIINKETLQACRDLHTLL